MPAPPPLRATTMSKHLLLTGPVNASQTYADAARLAGWEVTEEPLVEIHYRDLDADDLFASPPHWVVVTSSSALPALSGVRSELVDTPFACVGERTAERLGQLGFRVALDPAPDAAALARAMHDAVGSKVRSSTRVLWPRGSLSTELGELLEAQGFLVTDCVAYETAPRKDLGPFPAADAVFFASPSAVRRYVELVRFVDLDRPLAIAIGETTLEALKRMAAHHFDDMACLDRPNPTELGALLAQAAADDEF